MGIVKDLKNLVLGLTITGKHLGRHAITLQYPEEKMEMPPRSRGIVVLLSDKETGELNCTACELCMRACPTRAIKIVSHRDENKRKVLDSFVVDNTICCFCGLCEEACNFCAIKMAQKYEFSTTNKEDLIWDIKRLQEVGLDVPYEDTRKKKKAASAVKKSAPPKTNKPDAATTPADKPKSETKPQEPKDETSAQAKKPASDEKTEGSSDEAPKGGTE